MTIRSRAFLQVIQIRRISRGFAIGGLGLAAIIAATPLLAQCPSPTNDVPLDMERSTPMDYSSGLQIINLYWSDHWDSVPGHERFRISDIDKATKDLVESSYFDLLCQ